MSTKILKAILIGALVGAAVFFMPFPFRFFLPVLFIFFAIRFIAGRRRWHTNNYYGGYNIWNDPKYAERWRNMNDAQRNAFLKKIEDELNTPQQ